MLTLLACHALEKQAPGDSAAPPGDTAASGDTSDTAGTTDSGGESGVGVETGEDSALDTGEDTAWSGSKALCEVLVLDDLWADGHPESGYLSRVDASGKLQYEAYTDGDGVPTTRLDYSYDGSGNLVVETHDLDGDAELTVSKSWDAADNALSESWDYDGLTDAWGTPYVDWSWTLSYDADDNVLTSTYDTGADGLSPDVWTYTYAGGLRVTQDVDYAGDGVLDAQYRYTYDADGNQLTTELVDEGSWLPSEAYTWRDGRLSRLEHYRDGALAWWSDYAWDEAGDPVEEVQYEASGEASYRTSYSYDCP